MQAPKQELFLVNWEVANLTKKLQTFSNLYSYIDLKTVDLLSQLIGTLNAFLTNKSLIPVSEWDEDDEAIFKGYTFARSINCNHCDRSIRITKPSLAKHLCEHKSPQVSNDSSKPQEVLLSALRGSTDELVKPMAQLSIADPSKKMNNGTGQTTTINSQCSVSSAISDPPKSDSKQSTAVSKKPENSQKPTTESKGSTDKLEKPMAQLVKPNPPKSMINGTGQARTLSVTIGPKKENAKRSRTALKKSNQSRTPNTRLKDQPKRKDHRPQRSPNVQCLEVGCLPEFKGELTKKLKSFVINMRPLKYLEQRAAHRMELTNSPAHNNIVQNLEQILRPTFHGVKVYPFGSRITGLGNTKSDLDLYVDLNSNYNGLESSREKQQHFIQTVADRLHSSNEWRNLDPVTSARTPILRAWNILEKIDCDLSFSNGLSHSNTKLIQYLFDLQPVCFYVAMYLKDWSKHLKINGLNTYTLIMLTIYFFQEHNLLPSIYDLQKNSNEPLHIKHWQAHFEKKSLDELGIPLIEKSAVETYLVGFFSFYGLRFSFETHVVCTYLGWAPLKEDFDPVDDEIPVEMEHLQDYYTQLDMSTAHSVNDLLSYAKPMVVQDPFELIHNVSKGLTPMDVSKFKHYCTLTAVLLDEQFTHINNK